MGNSKHYFSMEVMKSDLHFRKNKSSKRIGDRLENFKISYRVCAYRDIIYLFFVFQRHNNPLSSTELIQEIMPFPFFSHVLFPKTTYSSKII